MAGSIQDLIATSKSSFRIGKGGPVLKQGSPITNLTLRNTGDTADADVTVNKVSISGDSFVLNSDAVSSGADWSVTFSRATSGMTAAHTYTLPPTVGNNGDVLTTNGAGVLTWAASGAATNTGKLDTTTVAFNATSPVAMFNLGANDIIKSITVVVDTVFNGTPTLSIGISGTVSKYAATTDIDLAVAASHEVNPGLPAPGSTEAIIATYVAGGATAGSARILVEYGTPS